MKQWLFVVRPVRPEMLTSGLTSEELDSVRKHFGYWQELTTQEVALVVGRTQTTGPETMGIAIFRAETEAEAQTIASNDPAVIDGVFDMQLLPYAVAILGNPDPFRV